MDISLYSVAEMMVILILLDCYKLQWSIACRARKPRSLWSLWWL